MLKKLLELINKLLKNIKNNFVVITTILNLIILGYQGKLLKQQIEVSKEQNQLQKDINEYSIQPFFKISESIYENNKNIEIANFGDDCYIHNVTVVSLLKVGYNKTEREYEEILIPFEYFEEQFPRDDGMNRLVYEIRGYKNSNMTVNLRKNSNYNFLKETFVKITYTDRRNNEKIIYFSSHGKKINNNTGADIVKLYGILKKEYRQNNEINDFNFKNITIERIDNIIKNTLLVKNIKKISNKFNYKTNGD